MNFFKNYGFFKTRANIMTDLRYSKAMILSYVYLKRILSFNNFVISRTISIKSNMNLLTNLSNPKNLVAS